MHQIKNQVDPLERTQNYSVSHNPITDKRQDDENAKYHTVPLLLRFPLIITITDKPLSGNELSEERIGALVGERGKPKPRFLDHTHYQPPRFPDEWKMGGEKSTRPRLHDRSSKKKKKKKKTGAEAGIGGDNDDGNDCVIPAVNVVVSPTGSLTRWLRGAIARAARFQCV